MKRLSIFAVAPLFVAACSTDDAASRPLPVAAVQETEALDTGIETAAGGLEADVTTEAQPVEFTEVEAALDGPAASELTNEPRVRPLGDRSAAAPEPAPGVQAADPEAVVPMVERELPVEPADAEEVAGIDIAAGPDRTDAATETAVPGEDEQMGFSSAQADERFDRSEWPRLTYTPADAEYEELADQWFVDDTVAEPVEIRRDEAVRYQLEEALGD